MARGCGEVKAKFCVVLTVTVSVEKPASDVLTAGGFVNSEALKSLTLSRRKLTPILKLCRSLAIERSSTICHWSTFRPCGKKTPKGKKPPTAPRQDMLLSDEQRICGNVALALFMSTD